MRDSHIPSQLKKPILLGISVLFFLLLIHLIGVYLYMGGKYVGLPGGSTSIAIIGEAPDMLQPLSYGKNPNDEIIYPFIYRGLIRYNVESGTAQGDLAECDISKIESITCTLKQDMRWSDGSIIKEDDVIATFRAFSASGQNLGMQETLRDTRIEIKDGKIVFNNPDRDIAVLKMLTYPIFRSDSLEQARTGRFGSGSHITSGQYTFSEQVRDTAYMHDRITLIRNPNTSIQKAWFDKIHFKFFENITSLKNAEDTVGIILPGPRNEPLSTSARFLEYDYRTYEYFSVFFHTDRIPKNIRNILHWQIGTSLSGQLEENHRSVKNIFPGRDQILPRGNIGNFPDIMKMNGYMKRDEWIANIEATPSTITGNVVYEKPLFFTNKQNSKILFTDDATGGLLLTGKFDTDVSKVIINGYQLKEFRPNSQNFSYRVSLENQTLKEGKNTYLLEGIIGDTGVSSGEILTVYYTKDRDKMAEYKKEVDAEYIAKNNTAAIIAEREREKDKQKEAAIALDPLYYYDKNGKPFVITVAYVTGPQSTQSYGGMIEKILKGLSIKTELIPLEPKALESIITTGKKDYDILIAGISVGDSVSDIGNLFDPDEAGKGINFSNIEIERLSTLFSELRSATTEEDINKITTEIITIMEDMSFFMPISSPLRSLYIDRNLKGIRYIPVIAGPKNIYEFVEFASIKDEYIFNSEGKSFTGFFRWVGSLLF